MTLTIVGHRAIFWRVGMWHKGDAWCKIYVKEVANLKYVKVPCLSCWLTR